MSRRGLSLLLCLILCSCAAIQPSPAGEPDVDVPPSQTATAPLETPVQTPTSAPSTTSPQVPLSESGPWAVVLNSQGIWASNEDGYGLTHLTEDVVLRDVLSFAGHWIAYVTENAAGSDADGGLELRILSLPEGDPRTITGLEIPGVTADSPDDLQFAADQVYRAVVFEEESLTWSPDGTQLAFVSGHDGESSDLYVFSAETGEIVRLTDGPSHAYQLSWSPDGQYIFHTGASNFGSGAGYMMEGVWAARADGTDVRSLYAPDERSAAEEFVGWLSTDTVLVNSWRPDCGKINLRAVNVVSGEMQVLWPDYFNRAVQDAATDVILLDAQDISCNPEGTSGFYALRPRTSELELIPAEEFAARLPEPTPDPVPAALRDYLETLLEVESLIWIAP